MIDAFIFDVGGVLLVPHAGPIGEVLGMDIDPARAEEAHYHGVRALDSADSPQAERVAYLDAYVQSLGVSDADRAAAIPRLQALFSASNLPLWRQPVRGSIEALRRLAGGARKLAIVSNADGTVEEQLKRAEICQVGEGVGVPVLAIIDSTVVGIAKPAAEIFRHALEPLQVAPERAAYIGDTRRYDVAGARAAGLQPIHFDPYSLCPAQDDHAHIASLDELERMAMFSETVELRGHIIDSYVLPQIMDEVMDRGGEFVIEQIDVGRRKNEPSYARIQISAPTRELLDLLLDRAQRIGATSDQIEQVQLEPAPADGVFPEDFYSTTNLDTEVRLNGQWVHVEWPEMDCAVAVDPTSQRAWTVALSDIQAGELVVVGHEGVKVNPLERPRAQPPVFAFMGSNVSSEKPKVLLVHEIAERLRSIRSKGGRVVLVGGPVLVHTGSRDLVAALIREGYVNILFGGNGLATHDIEVAMFGTSLGVSLEQGVPREGGHEHHLRAINRVRRAGSIKHAVEQGLIQDGIMHACVQSGATYILAGSIRDDGPLPDVVTDALEAQRLMRAQVRRGVDLVLVLSSMLHGIATGNLLSAAVTTVCVDINPAVVTKLADRGSFQAIGLVMDVEGFLRELCSALGVST